MDQKRTFYTFNNKAAYIFAIIGMIVAVASLGLSIGYTFTYSYNNEPVHKFLLFSLFQYFTIQTNLIVLIFFSLFWINQWKPFIKTSVFQNISIAYITVTFIVYAALFLPDDISTNAHAGPILLYWTQNIMLHFINPIVAIIFLFCQSSTTRPSTSTKPAFPYVKFWKYALISMVWPTLYVAFLITINFIKIDGEFHTFYGRWSNFNSSLTLWWNNTTGSLWNLWFAGVIWLLFVSIALGYYWIDRKVVFQRIYQKCHKNVKK